MPFQPVGNTAAFACLFAVGHTQCAQFTVYCNRDDAPWSSGNLILKATDISDAIVADYVPKMSQDHDFIGVVARDLEVEFGTVEEVLLPAVEPGALASPSLPGNVAVVATFKSAAGAPRRGRIYLLPPGESQVVGDLLSVGAQGDLQAAADSISAAVGAGVGPAHVIVSRFSGSELRSGPRGQTLRYPVQRDPALIANVASVQVKRRIDSMRTRLTAESA